MNQHNENPIPDENIWMTLEKWPIEEMTGYKPKTTFWEDFNIDWLEGSGRIDELPTEGQKDIHGDYGAYCYKGFRHSLCHGWASGPAAFMSEYVLGIKTLSPGCSKISLKPNLGNLKHVKGTYPTPHGIISVEHIKRSDGTIQTKISLPAGVSIE